LAGIARFVGLLADQGGLRTDLPAGEAIDVVWALNSHAVHDLLVNRRRWTSERYRDWLADMLARSLLPDDLAAG
ncbi:MAG TPA: TetR/AcrR family transcriptional regulator, partial [Actinomycetes bacterium]|nr:TetR/AcrR family transcriptional regulator [Actinomycetes bacterium]